MAEHRIQIGKQHDCEIHGFRGADYFLLLDDRHGLIRADQQATDPCPAFETIFRSPSIRLGADKVDVQCLIATYSLSAHADESQIINLTETLNPEQVFLVHGDLSARASLEKALSACHRIVYMPQSGQTFELKFEGITRFVKPDKSTDLRARQSELNRQRREQMRLFADTAGKWVVVKGDDVAPVRCLVVEIDHLWVEIAPGLEQAIYPEAVLAVMGANPPTPAELSPFAPCSPIAAAMEPKQALTITNAHFPPGARLRKSGYRLADHILVLTFDFPVINIVNELSLILEASSRNDSEETS